MTRIFRRRRWRWSSRPSPRSWPTSQTGAASARSLCSARAPGPPPPTHTHTHTHHRHPTRPTHTIHTPLKPCLLIRVWQHCRQSTLCQLGAKPHAACRGSQAACTAVCYLLSCSLGRAEDATASYEGLLKLELDDATTASGDCKHTGRSRSVRPELGPDAAAPRQLHCLLMPTFSDCYPAHVHQMSVQAEPGVALHHSLPLVCFPVQWPRTTCSLPCCARPRAPLPARWRQTA